MREDTPVPLRVDIVECHLHFFCIFKEPRAVLCIPGTLEDMHGLRELIKNFLSGSFCQCPGDS